VEGVFFEPVSLLFFNASVESSDGKQHNDSSVAFVNSSSMMRVENEISYCVVFQDSLCLSYSVSLH
jgi:hypothetical protein